MGQHFVPRFAATARPHKLKGFWFLIRRVPAAFKTFDRRNPVRISTGIRITDDPRGVRAGAVVSRLDGDLARYWNDKRLGKGPEADARYRQACERARTLGFTYVPAIQAAPSLPIEDVLRRFEALILRGTDAKPVEVVAVLGGEAPAEIMTATMLDEFEDIVRASLAVKSDTSDRFRVTVSDKNHRPEHHFKDMVDAVRVQVVPAGEAYQTLEKEIGTCGTVEIAGASAAAPFVSALAAAIAVARAIAIASGCEVIRSEVGRALDAAQHRRTPAFAPCARGIGHGGRPSLK